MKVSALFKIIVREFRRELFGAVLLLALVDFLYANFTGISLAGESGTILWQGGNEVYLAGFSTVLVKLLNVSIIFITIGKIADKLSGDLMVYLLARAADYRKFILAYTAAAALLGEMLLVLSHLLYYCFAGFYPEQAASAVSYLVMDCLGFPGMLILYFILHYCCFLENGFLYLMGIYLLNTVLPVPILPAMSTVKFVALRSRIPLGSLGLLLLGTDLIAAVCYEVLIKRRRVNLC